MSSLKTARHEVLRRVRGSAGNGAELDMEERGKRLQKGA